MTDCFWQAFLQAFSTFRGIQILIVEEEKPEKNFVKFMSIKIKIKIKLKDTTYVFTSSILYIPCQ